MRRKGGAGRGGAGGGRRARYKNLYGLDESNNVCIVHERNKIFGSTMKCREEPSHTANHFMISSIVFDARNNY